MNYSESLDSQSLPRLKKRLETIPNLDRRRLLTALNALHTGPSGDIKPLKKGHSGWRLGVGSWRILLPIDEDLTTIRVAWIDSRWNVYK